jgi:O-antigen/teichoic acid export membrane protein
MRQSDNPNRPIPDEGDETSDQAGPTPGGDAGKTGGDAPVVGMRDTVLTFVSRVISLSLALVWQFLLAHFLDTAGRGAYAVATQYASLLTVIFMLGVDVGSLYYVAARKMAASEAAMALLVYSLLGSAVAIPVGLLLMNTGWEYFNKADPLSFYIMVAVIPLSFFSASLVVFLTSLREFAWSAVLSIAGPALNLASLVVFVWVLGWGVNGALLTLITTEIISLAVVLVILRRRHGLHFVWPTGEQFRQVLGFGVRYYFGKVSNIMNFQLGTLALAFFATQSEIGVFAFGLTLVERVQFLPDTLTTVLLPRVSSDAKGRVDLVTQCNRIVIVLAGAALVVLSALAWPVFALLVPTFLPAVMIIWILAPGVWIRCASKLFVPYLHSQNRVGVTSIAVAAGAVVNIAILVGLMPYLGIQAAALSVVGNYVVSATILVVAFHRVSGVSVRDAWLPRRSDLEWFWQGVMAFWRRLRPAAAGK